MKERLIEFFTVIESSRKTEVSILVALLTPGLIVLFGSWIVGRLEFPQPFEAFAAVWQPLAYGFLLLAIIAFIRLGAVAHDNYQRALDRLFRG